MADTKLAKDKSTMFFVVIVLLLTLVGAGAGLAVGSILQSKVAGEAAQPAPATLAAATTPEKAITATDSHATPASGHGNDTAHGGEESAEAEAGDGQVQFTDPHSLRVISFPPVLTTLLEPKGKWIRLEGSILTTADAEDPPELLAERSGEQILTYLRSLRLDQIEGPTNVLGLREDITEMLYVLSKGQVKGILINGLVVE